MSDPAGEIAKIGAELSQSPEAQIEILTQVCNDRLEENRDLKRRLSEKEAFIESIKKCEQYYCKSCGLYGSNKKQHEKYCKAELITLKGRTIELEKVNKLYHSLLFEVIQKYKNETRHETAIKLLRQAQTQRLTTFKGE